MLLEIIKASSLETMAFQVRRVSFTSQSRGWFVYIRLLWDQPPDGQIYDRFSSMDAEYNCFVSHV